MSIEDQNERLLERLRKLGGEQRTPERGSQEARAAGLNSTERVTGPEVDPFRQFFDSVSEAGYAKFREEFFDDPEMVKAHPNHNERETQLRDFWDQRAEVEYAGLIAQDRQRRKHP